MDSTRNARYTALVSAELPAAYNLARWLVRDSTEAEDVVQEALVRGLQYFDGYRGGSARSWFLAIVRNVALGALGTKRRHPEVSLDDDASDALMDELAGQAGGIGVDPADVAGGEHEREILRRAIGALPTDQRAVVVLRDIDGLGYREIAEVLGIPIGTVMSRLSRGRDGVAARLNPGGERP